MESPQDCLVLATGATGFVGSCVLRHLLQAGYPVRAAVRSAAKMDSILARLQIQSLNPGSRLTFTMVPDSTAPGAYDEAAKGVTHIVHMASPLPSGRNDVKPNRYEEHFVYPAVRGTLNVLEAAARAGSVRRVVITSSLVAVVPLEELKGKQEHGPFPILATDRIPFTPGPYESAFAAYVASEVAALREAETWFRHCNPSFDYVHLHPGCVLGPNEAATTLGQAMQGSNSAVLALLLGERLGPYPRATVYVEDVARTHVAALSPEVPGDKGYILSEPAIWNDAISCAKRRFPEVFCGGFFVEKGNIWTVRLPIDMRLTEQTFGLRFAG